MEVIIKPAIVTILKDSTHPSVIVTRNNSYFDYSYSNNILLLKTTGLLQSAGFFIDHDFSQYLGLNYKLVIKYGVASSGSNITSVSDITPSMTVYHSYGSADQSTDGTGKQALIATDAMKQAIINGAAVSERQYLILPIDSFFTAYYKYLLFWMGSWGTKYMTWAIEEIYIAN